jgi:hypothetical protein
MLLLPVPPHDTCRSGSSPPGLLCRALDGVVQLVSTLVQLEAQRSSSLAASAKLPLTGVCVWGGGGGSTVGASGEGTRGPGGGIIRSLPLAPLAQPNDACICTPVEV